MAYIILDMASSIVIMVQPGYGLIHPIRGGSMVNDIERMILLLIIGQPYQ